MSFPRDSKEVKFIFDLKKDTARNVAREMVRKVGLSSEFTKIVEKEIANIIATTTA